jgi:tetratricopeptide (TPR) repeat protein
MQFEMTRTELVPDEPSLQLALRHAREACRIDSQYGEAWATLGFVLQRAGRENDAVAASRRAVSLEPDNWRHRLRLAYASWGEERLREARRTLALLPGFPMAHWLIVTVLIARQAFDEAGRELAAGLAAQASAPAARFSAVGLHWLSGLLMLADGRSSEAKTQFEHELAQEAGGQLYARECSANAWYALGALAMRQSRPADAGHALREALRRQPRHGTARVALAVLEGRRTLDEGRDEEDLEAPAASAAPFDRAWAQSIRLALSDDVARAATVIDRALADAAPGSAGWLLPLEPLLQVARAPTVWAAPLARLRNRAA